MFPPIFQLLKTSTAVKSYVGTNPIRIYRAGRAPQPVPNETPLAYMVWQIVGLDPENQLDGTPGADKHIVQLDNYHPDDKSCELMAKAGRDALEGYCYLTGMPINERETETKLYRIALQFDFIHLRDA